MTEKAKDAVLKMKRVPFGIIGGACGIIVLLSVLGLVLAYVASAVTAAQTSNIATFLGTWQQTLIFAVAIIAATAGVCSVVFYALKKSVVQSERSDCFYELDKVRFGNDYLSKIYDAQNVERELRVKTRAEKKAKRKEVAAAKKRMGLREKTDATIVGMIEVANAQTAVIDRLKAMLDEQAGKTRELSDKLEQANARIVALEGGGSAPQARAEQSAAKDDLSELTTSVRANSEFIAELKAQREKRKAAARRRAELAPKSEHKKPSAKEQMENMQRELAELRALLESVANKG